jgi:peptide/nickel transport system substrate-binding protein
MTRARRTIWSREKRYVEARRLIVDGLPMVRLLFGAKYIAPREPVSGFEWLPDEIPRFRDLRKSAG